MELSPIEAFERYSPLGPDFLTWLLNRVLEDDVPGTASEPGLKVDIKGPLQFAGEGGEATKVTLAGDDAAAAPEVASALRQRKRLHRARVVFTAQQDTWAFTLEAETFDLKSVRLPVPPIPDRDEFLRMRVESTMRLQQLVDEMFEQFLSLRLSPDAWKDELEKWRRPPGAKSAAP